MSSFQDWNPVNIGHGATKRPGSNSPPNQPKKIVNNTGNKVKVDEETGEVRLVTVDKEFSQQIIKARVAKGMNQQQLATALSLDVTIIKSYENGTGKHNGPIISKIKSYLKINKLNQ